MVNRLVSVGDDNYLAHSVLVGDNNLPAGINTAAIAGKVAKGDLVLNVKDFGAVGDGVANDGAAIQSAVNAAISANRSLYWPAGTYLKTVNIANFHSVKHTGEGAVKHGSDTFYVAPSGIQANTLYVATSGAADTNDGLSPATPFRKVGVAVNALANYGPVLRGFWAVQLAAGTWSDRTVVPVGFDAANPVTIRGPIVNHPNVPTAIITEGYNISAAAIKLVDVKASFIISNIHFIGYNGTTASAGVQTSETVRETFLINCHFTDCYWGFTNQTGKGDIKGGIFQRCGYLGDTANDVAKNLRSGNGGGYRGLMQARHSIGVQSAGVLTNGPYFYNCVSGVFAQESCTGHVDFSTFEDCDYGVHMNVNSRANVDGSSFKRNKVDIRGLGNSHFFLTAANTFGTGADESGSKIVLSGGSQCADSSRVFTSINQSYSTSMKVADTEFPNQTVASLGNTVVYTATMAGMVWRDAVNSVVTPKRVVLRVYGELIGTAGTKVLTIRLGASLPVSATFTAAETGPFEAEVTAFFYDTAKQFVTLRACRHLGDNVRLASSQMTNAMTSATNLTVESSVGVSGDSVRFDAVDMSWG